MNRKILVLVLVTVVSMLTLGDDIRLPKLKKLNAMIEGVEKGQILVDSLWVNYNRKTRVIGNIKPESAEVGNFAHVRGKLKRDGSYYAKYIKIEKTAPGKSYKGQVENLSREEVKKLNSSDKLYKGEVLNKYVRNLGLSLVPEHERDNYDWNFYILDDYEINAFAYPNGNIYVYLGLLAKVDNEAQLASILAHEISHVTQKHGQRGMKSSIVKQSLFAVTAISLGVFLDHSGHSDRQATGLLAMLGLNLGFSAAVNGYGRNMEDQADRVGLRYSVGVGYDPYEALKVWAIFSENYGDTSTAVNIFYGNHSTNRLRYLNQSAEISLHYKHGNYRPNNNNAYQAMMVDIIRDTAVEDFNKGRYKVAKKGFKKVLKFKSKDKISLEYLEKLKEKGSKK